MNKLSLVGMQLYQKYIRIISRNSSEGVTPDEGPSLETSKFSLYFSGNCIPPTKACSDIVAYNLTIYKTSFRHITIKGGLTTKFL